ncbi:hypothetical protein [Chryseobacterium indologenes]|uniref:hypothetical protein n=1 Tax=Chryseobacterium indologenes TaxID=253 RepID=UPI0010246D6E|nr:hypothetical protein [Chryseobacterium indologenes]VFA41318.1 Uncharacterised protein [Chryseobacterium indologenes]
MAKTGDSFEVTLKKTHVGWGTYRKTKTRGLVYNEGYFPIPSKIALSLQITNLHNKKQTNIYKFSTSDGYFKDQYLKASGNTAKGGMYAKNMHGNGDLKLLGAWYNHAGIKAGDKLKIEFTGPFEILLTKI